MTDTKVRYEFNDVSQYLTDQGRQISLNPVLSPPTDLSDGQIDAILAAIGATRRTETAPCGDRGNVQPRKLRFIRRNGNSLSVIAPIRSDLITVANTIRGILNQTGFRVLCIELIGEHHFNLIEELAPTNKGALQATNPIKPTDQAGKHKEVYSSAMSEYAADSTGGGQILMPFQTQTDGDGTGPYSQLVGFFSSCVDPVLTIQCSGSTSIDYRRYIPSFLTTDGTITQLQTATAPVKTNDATQISQCGALLAQMTSVACLEYYGESNKKFHKLLTLAP
jgi:hypothetical protein